MVSKARLNPIEDFLPQGFKRLAVVALGCLSVSFLTAHAGTYRVTWDIGALSLPSTFDPTHLMYLDLQLTDGTNSGNGNASIDISNLALTGGSFQPALPDLGNVSYLPNGSILLTDGDGPTNAVADHAVGFIASSMNAQLSFDFTAQSTSYDTPPDFFNVALLQADESTVATLGPTQREFIGYELTSDPSNVPQIYDVNPSFAALYALLGDSRFIDLASPTIQSVPDPAPYTVMAVGLFTVLFKRRRRPQKVDCVVATTP